MLRVSSLRLAWPSAVPLARCGGRRVVAEAPGRIRTEKGFRGCFLQEFLGKGGRHGQRRKGQGPASESCRSEVLVARSFDPARQCPQKRVPLQCTEPLLCQMLISCRTGTSQGRFDRTKSVQRSPGSAALARCRSVQRHGRKAGRISFHEGASRRSFKRFVKLC